MSIFDKDPWFKQQTLGLPDVRSKKPDNTLLFAKTTDKTVTYTVTVPVGFNPRKINVSVSNFSLNITGDDLVNKTAYSFARSTVLPAKTDINSLKAKLVNDTLTISGALSDDTKLVNRTIPVE